MKQQQLQTRAENERLIKVRKRDYGIELETEIRSAMVPLSKCLKRIRDV